MQVRLKRILLLVAVLAVVLALAFLFYLPTIVAQSASLILTKLGFTEVSFQPALPGFHGVKLEKLSFKYPLGEGSLAGAVDQLGASYDLFERTDHKISVLTVSGGKFSFNAPTASSSSSPSNPIDGSTIKALLRDLPFDALKADEISLESPYGEFSINSLSFDRSPGIVLSGEYHLGAVLLTGTIEFSPVTGRMRSKLDLSTNGLKIAVLDLNGELQDGSELLINAVPASTGELLGVLAEPIPVKLRRDLSVNWGGERASLSSTSVSLTLPQLKLASLVLNPEQHAFSSSNWTIPVELRALDLPALLELYPQQGLTATGAVDADFTIRYSKEGISVREGRLSSVGAGGTIQYDSSALSAASQPGLAIAFEALRNFIYNKLSGTMALEPSGKLTLALSISGHNPDWQNGRAVDLNISLEENVFKLIETIRLTTRIEEQLDEVLKLGQ